jgi:hypothetical protein
MPQVKVMAKQRGIFATTNNQGEYHMYYDVVDDTLRVLPGPYWYWSVEPPYAVPSSPQQPLDFAVSIPSGIIDVGITAIELTPFRRGFDSEVLIQAHNYGSATADSILIAFDVQTMPAPLEYVSAVPSPLLVSGDYLVWLLDSLAPGATTTVQLVLHAPLSTAIGTLVSYDVQADLANDGYMKNNYFGTRSPVVGSFDPNDKRVSPENLPVTALDTAELLYVIRFQNTGTFPADFVVIRDSLPPKLNPATLNVIASSHPCTWQLEGYGYLEVRFDPIFLPDSTSNEPASHGFVAFTAQPRPYLLSGDLVRNRAGIYFDFNEPIITDYAVTKIETVTGMSEATPAGEPLAIGLSPNPVSRHAAARVEWPLDAPAPAVVEVLDLQGRRMQHTKVPAGNQQVLLDVLSPGAYWVRVRAAGRTGVKLLVAE